MFPCPMFSLLIFSQGEPPPCIPLLVTSNQLPNLLYHQYRLLVRQNEPLPVWPSATLSLHLLPLSPHPCPYFLRAPALSSAPLHHSPAAATRYPPGTFDNFLVSSCWNLLDFSGYNLLRDCQQNNVKVCSALLHARLWLAIFA